VDGTRPQEVAAGVDARTVLAVTRRSFQHRTETFGLDTNDSWALPALRLAFAVPRVYRPLADAWETRYPGSRKALNRLTEMGFLSYQPALVVDVRTGHIAAHPAAPLPRYRATAKGKRLAAAGKQDLRVVTDRFPRTSKESAAKVLKLLRAFDLETPHSRYGLSVPHATEISGMPERSGRWWVRHLAEKGYLTELDERIADVREVVPAHWRVTRVLCRQLEDVVSAFPATAPAGLSVEFRLNRTRFLSDIDPARIGITGATDFDHDIETQNVLSHLLTSPRCAVGGVFNVEPRITLPGRIAKNLLLFDVDGGDSAFYQPDAELREIHSGTSHRSVVEYERFQTRRDAWSHIERFMGWLHIMTLPVEPAILRFVVDTDLRARSYVELVEAFADWMLDHPERHPGNNVTLAVTSVRRIEEASDPLDRSNWSYIDVPPGRAETERRPVLSLQDTPYDEYFARDRR
jgi:hypothetical protein